MLSPNNTNDLNRLLVENPLNLSPNTRYEINYKTNAHTSGSHQNDGVATEFQSKISLQTGENACQLQLTVQNSQNDDVNQLPLRYF